MADIQKFVIFVIGMWLFVTKCNQALIQRKLYDSVVFTAPPPGVIWYVWYPNRSVPKSQMVWVDNLKTCAVSSRTELNHLVETGLKCPEIFRTAV